MSEEQIIQFFQDNIDYMVNNDIILWLFRTLGWGLSKMLASLVGVGKDLYDFTFGLVDITSWSGLDAWVDEFRPLIVTIMTVSLVVLGFMYMFGKNKKHNIATSILMFAVVATSSTFLFSTFNDWTIAFKDAVVSGEGVADGTALINSNLYDLLYIDDQIGLKNMSDDNRPQYTSIPESEIDFIKITEVMDWGDVEDSDTKDILKKKLQFRASGGSVLTDVYNGVAWTSIGNDLYFRYKFNFFTYFVDALSVVLIYFCLAYKNVRISYELLVGRVLVTLKSADISTQKKLVKIFESIKDQYFALCFTAITIRSYFIFTDFIKETAGSNGIMRGIVTLLVAFCVVDGSNIMQQISGVDAGLSSFTGKMIAGSHMAQGAMAAVNQSRMLHAMKQNSGTFKKEAADKADPASKGNVEGSRIGAVQFGRKDSEKEMDRDLEKTEEKAPSGGNAAGTEGEGKSGNRDQAVHPESRDANGSAQEMDQELGSDSRQPMEEGMAATMDGHMEQMEEDLDCKDGDKGYSDLEGSQKKESNMQGSEESRSNPEGNLFDKWGEKQPEDSRGQDHAEGKTPFREGQEFAEKHMVGDTDKYSAKQMNQPHRERTEGGSSYDRQSGSIQNPGMRVQEKGKSTADQPAKITEEKLGRDRYVGGEAVSRRKRKDKGEK